MTITMKTFPHGTPTGYDLGCRGSECANWHESPMTCTQAKERYRGDYEYIVAVANGTATTAKATFAKPVRVVHKSPGPSADRAAITALTNRVSPKTGNLPRHGTVMGFRRGCKTPEMCPETTENRESCSQVRNGRYQIWYANRKAIKAVNREQGMK